MLRVISFNANGIRASYRRGFFDWVMTQQPDVICLQELKAQAEDIQQGPFDLDGYQFFYATAEKKGYSGVGIYTKYQPEAVKYSLGWPEADREGRYLQIDFKSLSIASIYLPSGTSGAHRQAVKYDFLDQYYEGYLKTLAQQPLPMIICGDWNIAHLPIDLKNWRANQKNSGFLPEERAWLDRCFNEAGLVDAFRIMNQKPDQYTWWTYRGKARVNNVGWRIDYQIVTPNLKSLIRNASIYNEQVFSDHAPLIIDYAIDLDN